MMAQRAASHSSAVVPDLPQSNLCTHRYNTENENELGAFGAIPINLPMAPLKKGGGAVGPGDFSPYSYFHKRRKGRKKKITVA
jgi:hypothetical protein